MRPVSDLWLNTIRGSHVMAAEAVVCTAFQTGTDPAGTTIPILDGHVVVDSTADIRSSLDLTTDGTGMWPSDPSSLLAPYGNEVFIRRGLAYGSGITEWCSLGYFRVQAAEQQAVPDGPVRLTCSGRMVAIIEARLLAPRQYLPSATYGAVVSDLVLDVYPLATIEWDDATSAQPIGRTVVVEQDRFGGLSDVVASRGKIIYWDYRGVLVIKDIPSATAVVFEVNAGANGVLVSMTREVSRAGVHNAVVATGEAPDQGVPARGVAVDDNPMSPTYFYGRFGPVPRYYSSPLLLTDAEAYKAASTLLRKELGLPYSVDFSAIPNAALEPYDPVRVTYSGRDGAEVHVLEAVTVPLTQAGAMTATTREQTLAVVGSGA